VSLVKAAGGSRWCGFAFWVGSQNASLTDFFRMHMSSPANVRGPSANELVKMSLDDMGTD
jgi:hypothetical protein